MTSGNASSPVRPAPRVRPPLLILACVALGAAPASAAEPVATAEGEQPGARLELTELKRTSGDTLTLKFRILNEGAKSINFGYDFGDPQITKDHGSVGGVHILDVVNRKKHLVVRDGDGACVCSRGVEAIAPGKAVPLWAKLPAPPEDVERVSVVVPHFMPMDDVPIGR